MRGFPVRLDGPGQVSLFASYNDTFILKKYRSEPVNVTVSLSAGHGQIKNLITSEIMQGQKPAGADRRGRGTMEARENFNLQIPPHSYRVFKVQDPASRVAQQ